MSQPSSSRRVALRVKIGSRVALLLAAGAATPLFGQTAYFSTQGNFAVSGATQDFYFDLSRAVASSEAFRFETFSGRGTTLNAAGDTSPTSPTNFDSILTLTKAGAAIGSNDDGAAGTSNNDSLLSWPGLADSGGTLGTGPIAAGSDYRLRLTEFDGETGPWGVDLVGPANAITFRDFDPFLSASGVSNVRSIKFGTNGTAAVGVPAAQRATFKPTVLSNANYQLTGDLVVANTGNASFIMDSTDGDRFTVAGATIVKVGGDVTLSGNATLNLNAFTGIDGGRVALSGTSRLNVNASFANINSGGRIDVNSGATLAAPTTVLGIGVDGSAAEAQLVVTNGTVTTRSASIGANAGMTGRAIVTGANGRWTLSNALYVGEFGSGTLEVTAGGQVSNPDAIVGSLIGGVGTATVSGANSIWTSTGDLLLGRSTGGGVGTVTVGSGGRVNVGDASTGFTLTGIVLGDADLAGGNGGELSVFNGSTVTNASGGVSRIGINGGYGKITVSGTNSQFLHTNGSGLAVAVDTNAKGFLDILAGGRVESPDVTVGGFNGVGTVLVSGAGSVLKVSNNMTLSSPAGAGTGIVTLTNGGELLVGDAAGSPSPSGIDVSDLQPLAANAGGLLTIRNGSTVTAPGNVSVGRSPGTFGRVLVTGNASTLTGGVVFAGDNGRGDVRLEGGGDLVAGQLVIGAETTSDGTMTVTDSGSTATAQFLDVGTGNTGLLTIANGGAVTVANTAKLGARATGVGTLTLTNAGSVLDVDRDLIVGELGRGVVNLNGGAGIVVGDAATGTQELRIADANLAGDAGGNVILNNASTWAMNDVVRLADSANTHGRLAVNGGSTFSTNSSINVSGLGAGVLDVTAGGRVTLNSTGNGTELNVGAFGGLGTVTVDGSSSLLDVNNNVVIGNASGVVSTLTVRNGGLLLVGDLANPTPAPPAATRILVVDATLDGSSGGIINVRPGSLLDATGGDVVLANAANSFGRINLNGANARLLAANVTVGGPGRGQLDVAGGTLTATGTVSIAGTGSVVNLTAGTLVAPAISAASGGFSFTGGRLETTTYTGSLTQSGGTFAPNGLNNASPTTVSSGYVLNSGSVEVRLGATGDSRILATGSVALNGGNLALSVANYAPVLGDNFRIINSSGLTGHFATVSGVSFSPTRSFAVIYNATEVRYVVALPGDASLNRTVGFEDLLVLAQNYNVTGTTWVTGDFDGSGSTIFADLLILAQNYNASGLTVGQDLPAPFGTDFAGDWALAQSLVPEPATLAALGAVAPLLVGRRRRSLA